MMKRRTSAILCVIALLMTGCATKGGATVPPSGTEQSKPAAPSLTSEPAAPETTLPETGPETTAAPDTGTQPQSVTPGGFRVYTDSSRYTPYQAPQALYTRPENVDLSDFHPENAHGAVYPYTASLLYSSSPEGYSYESGGSYGFVDSTGTIVTDGTYRSIEPLREYDYMYNALAYQLPLWVVKRIKNVKVAGEEDGHEYIEGDMYCGVVAMDGSFSIPCDYRSIQAMDGRFVCFRDWDTREFSIFDLTGKLLLSSSQLNDGSRFDGWDINYGDGLYLVGYCSYGQGSESRYYYLNEAGERVLGPYSDASPFSEGLAAVSTDGGNTYGYIDKSGSWVIGANYKNAGRFVNGRTDATLPDDTVVLMDQNGNWLFESQFGWLNTAPCGYAHRYQDETGTTHSDFYDRDGNLLAPYSDDWECLSENVVYLSENDGVLLSALDGSVPDLRVPSVSWVHRGAAVVEGQFMMGFIGYDYQGDREILISEDLTSVYEIPKESTPALPDMNGIIARFDEVTGEPWYLIYDGRKLLVYGEDGTLACAVDGYDARIINRAIHRDTALASTYQSFDGELLFSYPFPDSGD